MTDAALDIFEDFDSLTILDDEEFEYDDEDIQVLEASGNPREDKPLEWTADIYLCDINDPGQTLVITLPDGTRILPSGRPRKDESVAQAGLRALKTATGIELDSNDLHTRYISKIKRLGEPNYMLSTWVVPYDWQEHKQHREQQEYKEYVKDQAAIAARNATEKLLNPVDKRPVPIPVNLKLPEIPSPFKWGGDAQDSRGVYLYEDDVQIGQLTAIQQHNNARICRSLQSGSQWYSWYLWGTWKECLAFLLNGQKISHNLTNQSRPKASLICVL
jgi:hypothetical protein